VCANEVARARRVAVVERARVVVVVVVL